jgi:hypothetical protein
MEQAFTNKNEPLTKGTFQEPWFEKTFTEDPAWRNQADGFVDSNEKETEKR